MDDQEFRRTHLGGSDAYRALVSDPLGVALEKRGEREPQQATLPMRTGLHLEPFVRELYEEKTGRSVQTIPEPLEHKDIPFFGAHLDGVVAVNGKLRVVDFKTTQKYDLYSSGEDPPYVRYQLHHYVNILASHHRGEVDDHYDIGALAGNSKFEVLTIPVDLEFMQAEAQDLQQFWMDYVMGDKSPPKIDPTRLVGVVKAASAIEATPDIRALVRDLKAVGERDRELAEERSRLRAQLCAIMGDAEAILDGERVLATFKEEKPRFSSSKLKESHPDLYEQCRADKGVRVLRLR